MGVHQGDGSGSGDDRYGSDVLAGDWRSVGRTVIPTQVAERDLVVERADNGFCGAVTGVGKGLVELEDRHGARRLFRLGPGFLIDGRAVALTAPTRGAHGPDSKAPTARTASGSFAVEDQRARVALPSRIFVEGRHDAELIEKVWGADLRVEGVVVEYLAGVDDLAAILDEFSPTSERRVGVLVDHLVPGSKESAIADAVMSGTHRSHVVVVGHPFIDIWEAVKPAALGIDAWPRIPRGTSWKHGVCRELGWPHEEQADIARAWQHILSRVRTFAQLEPALLGRVEELIDFVTEPTTNRT